ncbi:glycosyltransferase family 4 protein [Ureibacillus aquaedulcis]|uniref:Glycosyltransferase family 4 protein n=1 Tax=Ureibacillus aquaedulcis TaxID=3058421 RepID=A0ABT8GUM3_9BACL|nr:glycosyltransferase family 4 protein [Ureibacillus sp. BA0131]MDN4495108.1 glycosyltransferase family 4 protein [Ureibacillus sp. BA0131]
MKKRLLMYAHYYHPDVASTGQILKELAEGMLEQFEITVICVVSSYTGVIPKEYNKKKYYFEEINGVKIVRVQVPEFSKTNKISRVNNIIWYFIRALMATFKVGKQDYVYSISQPPILGGLLGVIGKWIKKAKYIYNIQDFNPEQTMAVNYSENKIVLKTMMYLDKFSCKQAHRVIVVGRDMEETLNNRFKSSRGIVSKKLPKSCYINNWINEKEIYPLEKDNPGVLAFKRKYGLENKFVIMYSGNIGLYYDLENLIKVIAKFKDEKEVVFAFVGEGTVLNKLQLIKDTARINNVVFIPYQEKADLIYSLNAGDVHWVVNAKGIRGVSVPSKLYGVMAAGKPVLGVLEHGSEARLIIEESKSGYVTEPGNYKAVECLIQRFVDERGTVIHEEMCTNGRDYLVNHFTKEISIKKYIEEILNLQEEISVERKSIDEQY